MMLDELLRVGSGHSASGSSFSKIQHIKKANNRERKELTPGQRGEEEIAKI